MNAPAQEHGRRQELFRFVKETAQHWVGHTHPFHPSSAGSEQFELWPSNSIAEHTGAQERSLHRAAGTLPCRPTLHGAAPTPAKLLKTLLGAKFARSVPCGGSYRYMRAATMKTQIRDIIVRRLDERRYALAVDGVVRYVGSEEECQRRLAMLAPKKDRADQDKALARLGRILR